MTDSKNTLPRSRRWRAPLIILAILGLTACIAGAALWWVNRPIQATVLTTPEKATLEQKMAAIDPDTADPEYVPGEKEIVLTERELNGLIHEKHHVWRQAQTRTRQRRGPRPHQRRHPGGLPRHGREKS